MKFDKLLDLTEYLHVLFCCFFVFTSFLENMVVFFVSLFFDYFFECVYWGVCVFMVFCVTCLMGMQVGGRSNDCASNV